MFFQVFLLLGKEIKTLLEATFQVIPKGRQVIAIMSSQPTTRTKSLRGSRKTVDIQVKDPIVQGSVYRSFVLNGQQYSVGDAFFLENQISSHRYVVFLTLIKIANGKVVIKGNWMQDGRHMIGLGNPQTLKDRHQMDADELLFLNCEDVIPPEHILEKCIVLSKDKFKQNFPKGFRADRSGYRAKGGLDSVRYYYCERGIDCVTSKLLDYDWEDRRQDILSPIRIEGPGLDIKIEGNTIKRKSRAKDSLNRSKSSSKKQIKTVKPSRPSGKTSSVPKTTSTRRNEKKKDEMSDEEQEFEQNASDSSESEMSEHTSEDYSTEEESDDDKQVKRQKTKSVKLKFKVSPERLAKAKELAAKLAAKSTTKSVAMTSYQKACEKLHVSAVPASLPCREEEFANIYTQLESAIEQGEGTCIYISGVPGTGKTASVNAVMRALQEQASQGDITPFDLVELNGMKLSEPNQAYVSLWSAVSGQKASPSHAESLLYTYFTTPRPNRKPCVVIMDELDLLVTKKQSVVYNFFDWPNLPYSRLIVVAIANTMDLPERMLTNKVSSRLGLARIAFRPYDFRQLAEIIESRLQSVIDIDPNAIQFCARKIGSVSGDARRALDLCRRAVEIVENIKGNEPKRILIKHIEMAFVDLFSSPILRALKNLGFHQRTFLVAILRRVRADGRAQVEYRDVICFHLGHF